MQGTHCNMPPGVKPPVNTPLPKLTITSNSLSDIEIQLSGVVLFNMVK